MTNSTPGSTLDICQERSSWFLSMTIIFKSLWRTTSVHVVMTACPTWAHCWRYLQSRSSSACANGCWRRTPNWQVKNEYKLQNQSQCTRTRVWTILRENSEGDEWGREKKKRTSRWRAKWEGKKWFWGISCFCPWPVLSWQLGHTKPVSRSTFQSGPGLGLIKSSHLRLPTRR